MSNSTFESSFACQAIEASIEKYDEIAQRLGTGLNGNDEAMYAKKWLREQGEIVWATLNPDSLFYAMLAAAGTGMTLNPNAKCATLITRGYADMPYIEFMLTYQGMINLACKTSLVKLIGSFVVYMNDTFKFKGTTTMPEHEVVDFSGSEEERGGINCAYSHIELTDGTLYVEVVRREELEEIQQNMQLSFNFSVWNSVFVDQMRRKTAIRRMLKAMLFQLAERCENKQLVERLEAALRIEEDVSARIGADAAMPRMLNSVSQGAINPEATRAAQQGNVVSLSSTKPVVPVMEHLRNQHRVVDAVETDLMNKFDNALVDTEDTEVYAAPEGTQGMPTGGFSEW